MERAAHIESLCKSALAQCSTVDVDLKPADSRGRMQGLDSTDTGSPTSQKPKRQGQLWLLKSLRQLDDRLCEAVEAVAVLHRPEASRDLFRGLTVSLADAVECLRTRPGEALFGPMGAKGPILRTEDLGTGPFAALARRAGLDRFELDVVLIALAAEVDTRYERLFAFVQDDVTLRRPTVETALNLLSCDIDEKISRRARFRPEAPLLGLGLLHLDAGRTEGLLGRVLRADEALVSLLLSENPIDARLQQALRWVEPGPPVEGFPSSLAPLEHVIAGQGRGRHGELFYVRIPDESYASLASTLFATVTAKSVLACDFSRIPVDEFAAAAHLAVRVARLRDLPLACENVPGGLGPCLAAIWATWPSTSAADPTSAPWVMCGSEALQAPRQPSVPIVEVVVGPLSARDRRELWRITLRTAACKVADADLDTISSNFTLGPARVIAAAADCARSFRSCGKDQASFEDLARAARAQLPGAASVLLERIEPKVGLEDLVLPNAAAARFGEAIILAKARPQLRSCETKFFPGGRGSGVLLLFSGPSGTGKTMAAEVLAHALGRDLFRLDLAQVVSKYIGETSKHIHEALLDVQNAQGVLLIDEAEALFGRRSEVRDSHDRYANQEIGYLLQRVECFDGVVVLTTNVPRHLDEAFRRRFTMVVEFPAPNLECRRRLWRCLWPTSIPLDADANLEQIVGACEFSGAHIRNVILHAASLALEAGSSVSRAQLWQAIEQETEKLSLPLPEFMKPNEPLRRLNAGTAR